MKGYLIKDLQLLWKQSKWIFIFMLVFVVLGTFVKGLIFYTAYAFIFASILPINALSYDEHSNFQLFSCTLPPSRTIYIKAKYILGLIVLLILTITYSISNTIKMILHSQFNIIEALKPVVFLSIIALVFTSLTIPFLAYLGMIKGRWAYILMFCLAGAAGAALIGSFTHTSELSSLSNSLQNYSVLLLLVSFIIYFISYKFSCFLYKKRVF